MHVHLLIHYIIDTSVDKSWIFYYKHFKVETVQYKRRIDRFVDMHRPL